MTASLQALQFAVSPSVLNTPFNSFTDTELQAYFRAREGANFFPVIDRSETSSAKIEAILCNRFEFNHETHELPITYNWSRNPSPDVEWQILLHKFYYAVGLGESYYATRDPRYLDKWVSLTETWIEQTPPGFIAGDVTGRRIQNWIYAFYFFVIRANAKLPQNFLSNFLRSLYDQVDYLKQNLAPARNHRTLELYAIFLASVVFPEMRDAGEWQRFSLAALRRNIHSDLRADGVHREQSTDYHHIVLKNFLCVRRLAKLNNIAFPQATDEMLVRALEFSMYVHRPDGVVPALSDGDAGPYLELLQHGYDLYGRDDFLFVATGGRRGSAPARRCRAFRDSGHYLLRSGWGEKEAYEDERYLVFDCGPLGDGNHGHFDLLSFEMAAFGRPLVVDPGRYTYDESGATNWRVKFRETAYHNTVLVDGQNQTRYTAGNRKHKIRGPEPDFRLLHFTSTSHCDIVHGRADSHEYAAQHDRCIVFVGGEYWLVTDNMRSATEHRYDLLFHLDAQADECTTIARTPSSLTVRSPNLSLCVAADEEISAELEQEYVSSSYGRKLPAPMVRLSRQASDCEFHSVLFPFATDRPRLSIAVLPINGGKSVSAVAVRAWRAGRLTRDVIFMAHERSHYASEFAGFRYDGSYLVARFEDGGSPRILNRDPGATVHYNGRVVLPEFE